MIAKDVETTSPIILYSYNIIAIGYKTINNISDHTHTQLIR